MNDILGYGWMILDDIFVKDGSSCIDTISIGICILDWIGIRFAGGYVTFCDTIEREENVS